MANPSLIKHKLFPRAFLLLTLILACALQFRAETTETISSTTADWGYENGSVVSEATVGDFTLTFSKGTGKNAPAYYTSDSTLRFYDGNTVTVTSSKSAYVPTKFGSYELTDGKYTFTDKERFTTVTITYEDKSVMVDNLYYSFDGSIATVTGYWGSITNLSIPNDVEYNGQTYSVTSIGRSAFEGCTGLTSVVIGNSVTSVGDYAFYGCTGISDLNIADSENKLTIGSDAFSNVKPTKVYLGRDISRAIFTDDTNLSDLTIGEKVTAINDSEFEGCTGLTSVTIPGSVTSIGDSAFYGCTGLQLITALPATPPTIDSNTFTDYSVPLSVTSIAYASASYWSNFQNISMISDSDNSGFAIIRNTICADVDVSDMGYKDGDIVTEITIGDFIVTFAKGTGNQDVIYDGKEEGIPIRYGNTITVKSNNNAYTPTQFWGHDLTDGTYSHDESYSYLVLRGKITIAYAIVDYITVDDIFYTVSGSTATVIGCADTVTDLNIPSEITYDNLTYTVTNIGGSAFDSCTGLTSVTIPSTIIKFGYGAFDGCTGLTRVNIYDLAAWCGVSFVSETSNPLYYAHNLYLNNQEITELVIPDSVTKIGEYAFDGCSGLNTVSIHNTLNEIGYHAFHGCTGLTRMNIDDLVAWCGVSLSTVSNPLVYAQHLYVNGTEVTELVIPNSVTSIGDYTFAGCAGLTSVTIPNTVTKIGDEAFGGCSGLTTINIPNSVTSIGYFAFDGCTGLTSVTIGNSVTSIGDWAFSRCIGLTSIVIPGSVTTMGYGVFQWCTELVKGAYPNSISNPFEDSFSENLVTISYPANETLIEDGLVWSSDKKTLYFVPCNYQGGFTIPESVSSIGDYAFYGCTGLQWIECKATIPPTITEYTFSDYSVPLFAASEDYKTADYWYNFTNIAIATMYTPTGTTFEVDGLKYEIIDVSDRTCRLYAIDESVAGDVVIPETVLYREREFTPIEISATLIIGKSAITLLTIPANISTMTSTYGVVSSSSLTKLNVNSAVTNTLLYASSVDELVIGASASEFSNDLATNKIGKLTIEDGETALTTTQFKCSGLNEVYLGRSISENTFAGITSLEKVSISNTVTSIGASAFSGCTGIAELKFEDGESELILGDDAFKDVALKEIYFNRQMNFANAPVAALETVEFGENVTSIETGAFKEAKSLLSVTSHNPVPPTTASTFSNETYLDGTLYVPETSVDAYKAAPGWEDFFEIVGLDVSGIAEIGSDDSAKVSVDGGAICVDGDTDVRIVAMNGATVYSGRGETRINLTPGVYIVIINNTPTKVAVK
jgi:hypothetical protein